MKCPTCHIDLKFADEDQKRIDYCPSCRCVWAFSGKLYPPGRSSHKGHSQTDAALGCGVGNEQKTVRPNWNERIGGLYLPKYKRRSALQSLLYFLNSASRP